MVTQLSFCIIFFYSFCYCKVFNNFCLFQIGGIFLRSCLSEPLSRCVRSSTNKTVQCWRRIVPIHMVRDLLFITNNYISTTEFPVFLHFIRFNQPALVVLYVKKYKIRCRIAQIHLYIAVVDILFCCDKAFLCG